MSDSDLDLKGCAQVRSGYFLLFPLDYLARNRRDRQAHMARKSDELWPIFIWLVPGIVLLSAALELNVLGLVALFGLEGLLLALAAHVYLRLRANQTVEVWLNLWLSMCGLALFVAVALFMFAASLTGDSDY